MFLKSYADFLEDLGLWPRTVTIYSKKIKSFLESGYSEADLKGDVDNLILRYSKGGENYDPKDHGNTTAALRKLKEFILIPFTKGLLVGCEKSFASFVPKKRFVSSYTISDGKITISYQKGFVADTTVTKVIPKKHYLDLIDILVKHKQYLSPSGTSANTEYISGCKYRYTFDGLCGFDCAELFCSKNGTPKIPDTAMAKYRNWLSRYIHV